MLTRSFLIGSLLIGTLASFATVTYISLSGSNIALPQQNANDTYPDSNISQPEKFEIADRGEQMACERTESCGSI
ncbi:MAG: hypothetical protein WA919_03800 [Coleofasciculaceae cyanobacterium]